MAMIHGKFPLRRQYFGIDEIHDRIQVQQAIFQRRAWNHQRMFLGNRFHRMGGLGVVIFDALRFVQNDHIGRMLDDGGNIAQDRLVIGDEKIGIWSAVDLAPVFPKPLHNHGLLMRKTLDFLFPLIFQGGGTDNQRAIEIVNIFFHHRHRNGLHGFAQAHFIGDDAAGFEQRK